MPITFSQLAEGVLVAKTTDTDLIATVIFYPNGEMADLIYGEIETKKAIKYVADGYRIFSIKFDPEKIDRIELEKYSVNIINEAIDEGLIENT